MSERTQLLRFMALGTALGDEKLVLEGISGNDALGRPFEYKVTATALGAIKFDDLVGTNATVRMEMGELKQKKTRYFNGFVSGLSHIGYDNEGHSRYELVLSPWLWFLTRSSDCRIFQEMSVPEILEQVFGEDGKADYKLDLRGSYPVREYCVQYRETTFSFVQRLMEHEGIYYYWEHKDGSHKIVLCDSMACHESSEHFSTFLYSSRSSGATSDYVVENWHARAQVTSGAFAHNSFDFKSPTPSPNSKLLGRDDKHHSHDLGDYELYDNPGDFTDRSDGERLAAIRREEVQSQALTVTAQTNARNVVPGFVFLPQEIPEDDQNVEHLVISSSFQATGGGNYRSGNGNSEGFKASFTAIPTQKAIFRPQRVTPPPFVKGPQTAIVVGPGSEEIYVDEFGRVKLQFLWDRYGQFNDGSSCWIRVSQMVAGNGWGAMSIPRVGQEVIVEFLEGNPDRPIITGRVYNGASEPPYSLPDEKTKTTVKTRSTPDGDGFNEIRFEDKKGKEQLFIHAERNRDLRVKNTNRTYIGNEDHLVVHKDRHQHLEENEYRVTEKSEYVKVKEDSHVIIEGDRLDRVQGDEHALREGKQILTIDGDKHLDVGGNFISEIGGNHEEKTTGNIHLKSTGGSIALDGAMGLHIKGGINVVIEASASLTIKAGGSYVSCGPSGVSISGPTVLINSGGVSGSGSGASVSSPRKADSPDDPEDPDLADDAIAGDRARYDPAEAPTTSFDTAAANGAPFCEICAAEQSS